MAYGDGLAASERREGPYPVVGSGGISGSHDKANFGGPGIVIGRKGSYGSIHWIPSDGFAIDTAYFIDSTLSSTHLRWLYYALQAVDLKGTSQDVGVPGLSREIAYGVLMPEPPRVEEQRQIADFLDAETSRIDRLSLLQSAVLDRLAVRESALRDRSIDALAAERPMVALRRFIWSVDQGSSPQCEAVPAEEGEWGVLKVSCLRPGYFLPDENKRLPDDIQPDKSSEVREGDLLITRANTPQLVGSTAVVGTVRSRLLLSDKIFRVRLTDRLLPEYVAEIAAGTRIRDLCAASSNGASQSMANIRFEEVKAWPVPLADLDEQRKFVTAMSESRQSTARLRTAITKQLALLAERRQALITAAVTGQFDVSTASGRNTTQGV